MLICQTGTHWKTTGTLGCHWTDYIGTTLADAITQWSSSGNPELICSIGTHWETTGSTSVMGCHWNHTGWCSNMNKLMNKQLSYRWFDTPWRPCDDTVMLQNCRLHLPFLPSQRTQSAIITWRRNDVATSFRRHNDAIIESCARWVPYLFGLNSMSALWCQNRHVNPMNWGILT